MMVESLKTSSEKKGLPPGSLIHVGEVMDQPTRISLIDYNGETLVERGIDSFSQVLEYKDSPSVTWVIIEGLTNIDMIQSMGDYFDIHGLVLEDILNTHQRPKFEAYDNHLYVVLKSLMTHNSAFTVAYEQVSLLVLNNFVFMFKEKSDDLLDPIFQRLRASHGRIRQSGADYLMYVIMDTIVDQNFELIDVLDETMVALEEELFGTPTHKTMTKIQGLKRELITVRRQVSPIRELMSDLMYCESALINPQTGIYLRDVQDHALRVIELLESYRDILGGFVEIYMSAVNNRMNEVMKVLTLFASIFIPLTFLTGIYGMNFDYLPELHYKWAYPSLWILFIAIPVGLLVYFKKKRWL